MKIIKFLGFLAVFIVVGAEKQTRRAEVKDARRRGKGDGTGTGKGSGTGTGSGSGTGSGTGTGTGIGTGTAMSQGRKGCPVCPPDKPKDGSPCWMFENRAKKYNRETQSKKCKDRCPYGERCCNNNGDCFKDIRAICGKETKKWSIEERCSDAGFNMCGTDGNNYVYQKVCGNDGNGTDWKIYDKCLAENAKYKIAYNYTAIDSRNVRYGKRCPVEA